jgi:hypothetical protein
MTPMRSVAGIVRGVVVGSTVLTVLTLAAAPEAQERPRVRRPERDAPRQEAPAGTASIAGRVVTADGGRPMRRVRVQAAAPELRDGRSALTDDQGRYQITGLPAGRYTVIASKAGYLSLAYGQRRPLQPGTPIALRDAEALKSIDLVLPRGSVITGRVLDAEGEPLVRASVRALRYVMQQGEKRLVAAGDDQTDDRGEYRIYGLQPGDYYVSATVPRGLAGRGMRVAVAAGLGAEAPRAGMRFAAGDPGEIDGDDVGYAPTYYPGVTNVAEAGRVRAAIGEEVASIDFAVALVPMARILGVVSVTGTGGAAPDNARIMVVPETAGGPRLGMQLTGRIDADGSFTVDNVPPGRYVVWAVWRWGPMFGSAPVTVNGEDVIGVSIALSSGGSLKGAVRYEGAEGPPPDNLRISAQSSGMLMPFGDGGGSLGRDGDRFTLSRVPPGRVLLRANAGRDWVLKAVYLNGRDVTDTPLEIKPQETIGDFEVVFTNRATELTGSVQDADGRPTSAYTVLAFSADPSLWTPQSRFIQTSRPDQTGTFRLRGLPPGDYLVAAIDPVEQGEWLDPAFLDPLRASATPVTLGEGQTRAQNVKAP